MWYKNTFRYQIYLFANREYQFVSSSIVKEVLNLDKDISRYVDPIVQERMLAKKRSLMRWIK